MKRIHMKSLAVLLLVLSALGALATGAKYLSLTEFTAVHAALVGRSWAQLDANMQAFILGALKIMGAGFLGGGISLLCLAYRAAANERWPAWAAVLIAGSVWGPTLYVALLHRARHPGVDAPVEITAALLVMTAVASIVIWIANAPERNLQAPVSDGLLAQGRRAD